MVGVIGNGFVGGAVREVMGALAWDIDPERATVSSLRDLCEQCPVVFICVPTPTESGVCDISAVEAVVNQVRDLGLGNTIVVKSTVPPGTCDRLGVVFNPEFLTERNAVADFRATNRVILGGDDGTVETQYRERFPDAEYIHLTRTQAEVVKYAANCLLATKVAFCNEFWQVCDAMGVDYDAIAECLAGDERLGSTHWQVPGPDGQLGFGGSCFPKDIQAWMAVARQRGIRPTVTEAAWEKSCELR